MLHGLLHKNNLIGIFSNYEKCELVMEGLCNNKFADKGVKANAVPLKINDANDNYNIIISSQELGEKALSCNWVQSFELIDPTNSLIETANTLGKQANITVDGRQIEKQDSNVFKDIMPGVTIKALAPNIGGDVTKTQTVNIGPDTTKTGVFEDINKFFIARITNTSSHFMIIF